jgi:hypothetical protein
MARVSDPKSTLDWIDRLTDDQLADLAARYEIATAPDTAAALRARVRDRLASEQRV